MDDPVKEITGVIETLCTAEAEVQAKAIDKYFTENAQFIHPFCRTIQVSNSSWMIKKIYAWYKILSPRIEVAVDSIGNAGLPSMFDECTNKSKHSTKRI
jgi:hypothetical protein